MKRYDKKKSTIKVRIFCFLFACLMWVYVMTESNPIDSRYFQDTSVEIKNIDEIKNKGLVLIPSQDLKADVNIKGRRSFLLKKAKDGIKLEITMDDMSIGEHKKKIELVGNNSDINVTIQPETLVLKIDKEITIAKKVDINAIGSLEEGYYIDNLKSSVAQVHITGAESIVSKINKAVADIDISGGSDTIYKDATIKLLDLNGEEVELVSLDKKKAFITVNLKKEKIVSLDTNIDLNDERYKLIQAEIEPSTVEIIGPVSVLQNINSIKMKKIPISKLFNNPVVELELDIPENIYVVNKMAKLKTKVEKVNDKLQLNEFEYKKEEIEIQNNDNLSEEQLSDIKIPDIVTINFASFDTKIKKDDIKLYIDTKDIKDEKVKIKYKSLKNIKDIKLKPEFAELVN